jgi:methylmalonyl-CoA mutase cobalamin-binding subunit
MMADLLRWRSFEVTELGANTPAGALAEAAGRADRLVAVGIASTAAGHDSQVVQSVEALRRATPDTTILLGGNAIRSAAHARKLGADMWTGRDGSWFVDAVEGIMDARQNKATHNE